eukprot:g9663.t1
MIENVKQLNDYLLTSIPILGRDKKYRVRNALNAHKLMVGPAYFMMLYWKDQTFFTISSNLQLLIVFHVIYGVLWVVKDIAYPDVSWKSPATLASVLNMFFTLSCLYYSPLYCPVLFPDICPMGDLYSQYNNYGNLIQSLGIVLYVLGMFFHFVADAQKFFTLKYRKPRTLITEGLFRYTRNPNYLGEVMIYVGYAFLSGYTFTIILFMVVWMQVFLPNMLHKDHRLSRHVGFEEYKQRTGLLLPSMMHVFRDLKYAFCDLPENEEDKPGAITFGKDKRK